MEDGDVRVVHSDESSNTGKWIMLAVAILYVAGSLFLLFTMRSKLDAMAKEQADSKVQVGELSKRMQAAEADSEALAQQVGLTKKELAARSAELVRQQRAAEARLSEQQKKDISAVTGEVAGVKTDVGGVKTDVANTRSELEAKSEAGERGRRSRRAERLNRPYSRRSGGPET